MTQTIVESLPRQDLAILNQKSKQFFRCNNGYQLFITSPRSGLVRQQLDSFDEFIQMNVQRIVEDSPPIDLQGEAHHSNGEIETPPKYIIKFDQVKLLR